MNLTTIEVVGERIPVSDEFPVSYENHLDTEHAFVRIETDTEHVGYGEGTALPWFTGESTESMVAAIERWFVPLIEGLSLNEASAEFERFADSFPENPGAKTAIELALLDLKSKRAGVPLNQLLGSKVRDRVPTVYTIPGLDVSGAVEMAAEGLDAGFSAFKVKATGDITADVERINAVLDTVPDDATIRIDPNTSWDNFPTARRALDAIDDTDRIDYLEQPVSPDRPEDMRALWNETGVEVYADEFVHGMNDVARIGQDGLAAGFHTKLAKMGSLAHAHLLARIGQQYGLTVTVASAFGTSLGAAANLHLAAVLPNLSVGCELGPKYLSADPTTTHVIREPTIPVPETPGIGVELDDDLF